MPFLELSPVCKDRRELHPKAHEQTILDSMPVRSLAHTDALFLPSKARRSGHSPTAQGDLSQLTMKVLKVNPGYNARDATLINDPSHAVRLMSSSALLKLSIHCTYRSKSSGKQIEGGWLWNR